MSARDVEPSTRDIAGTPPTADEDAGLSRENAGDEEAAREPLVDADANADFAARWQAIQVEFVDNPRESVERADALVAELMQNLARSFAEERERLEQQWDGGDDVSTEDLRVSLTRYRSFFDRLLAA
jgi:hypothetical protein